MSALISYRNLADTAALSAAGTIVGYPISNVQTRQLSSVCRLTAASTQGIIFDFGAPVKPDVIAVLGINATSLTSALAIDYGSNGTTWNTYGAGGANDSGVPGLPRCVITNVSSITAQRYWRLRPQWARIGGAAYFEIARCWIGPAIIDPKGCSRGWRMGFVDDGTLDTSAGKQAYEDPKTRNRALSMSFDIPTELAYGFADSAVSAGDVPSFQGLQIDNGKTGDLIAIPRDTSALWMRRAAIYGHLSAEFDIEHAAADQYTASLTVIEER
jgi:hypothetical protein